MVDRTPVVFSGFDLEDAVGGSNRRKFPIPEGSFVAFVRTNHNPNRIELTGTAPLYTNVQLHVGNTPPNGEGCFAIGETRGQDFVGRSRPAMKSLLDLVTFDGSGDITVVVGGNSIRGPVPLGTRISQ